jgi:hypothetical protein
MDRAVALVGSPTLPSAQAPIRQLAILPSYNSVHEWQWW